MAEARAARTAPATVHMLPDALAHVTRIPRDLHLMLDFDGVLAPLALRPDEAVADPEARRLVARLAPYVPVTIITGRDTADAASRLDLPVRIIGGHGLDVVEQPAWLPALDRLQARLEQSLDLSGTHQGVLLERKRHSIACHYRLRPDAREDVEQAVTQALSHVPGLRLLRGHMVFEVRPDVAIDKGTVVAGLAAEKPDLHVVYVGDDVTDEDALAAARDAGGTGIIVAEDDRPTHAVQRLRHQRDVTSWLERLAAHVEAP